MVGRVDYLRAHWLDRFAVDDKAVAMLQQDVEHVGLDAGDGYGAVACFTVIEDCSEEAVLGKDESMGYEFLRAQPSRLEASGLDRFVAYNEGHVGSFVVAVLLAASVDQDVASDEWKGGGHGRGG